MARHKELSVVLVVAVLLQHADCLECYSCANVTNLAECTSLQQCPPGSICFSTFRSNKYTLGCKDASDCPNKNATSTSSPGGSGAIIGRAIINSCSQCCESYNCNRQLCQASDCQDSGELACAQVSALVEVCSNTDHAKKVCKKFCGLCDLVDGAWTDWSPWSACSVSCNNGTVTRARSCTNPSPASGGNDCTGISHETRSCVKDKCPVHGGWSDWSSWGTCSVSCGIGMERRDRSCSRPYPAAFGDHCFGGSSADRICFTAGCQDGGWSTWTAWGSCSQTCGGGLQKRSRYCTNPPPSLLGRSCTGDPSDVTECNKVACVDGGWSTWTAWSSCSRTCGGGLQKRSRSCTNPPPSLLGRSCTGDPSDVKECDKVACADGGWSTWTAWSSCSQTCGGGLQKRSRSCTNPPPSLLGRSCTGDALDVKDCTHNACQDHYVGFSVSNPKILDSSNITFIRIYANVGNRYNTSTGTFTCKTPGYYFFSLTVLKDNYATSIKCYIQKEGQTISGNAYTGLDSTGMLLSSSVSAYVHLALGDRVTTACQDSSHIFTYNPDSSFTGYMAHAD